MTTEGMSSEFEPSVVWGGAQREPSALLEKMLDSEFIGVPVISVRWDEPRTGESEAAYLKRVCKDGQLPHGKVQLSTRGAIENARFGFVEDSSPGQAPLHYHVVFAAPVTLEQAAQFISIFSDPIPNPAKQI